MKTLFLDEMNKTVSVITVVIALAGVASATDFQVATNGNDTNPGTRRAPFRTIQHAADLAQPGDVISVQGGIYRERINPPRGGVSDKKRIVYQAAPGAQVVITGSEIVKHWERVTNDSWKTVIPNSFFGNFNPYSELIHGDWFDPKGRQHHTGAVYLNGDWLMEAEHFDDVLRPVGATPLWFGKVSDDTTTVWAQFKGVDPNQQSVEINVRQTVFTPAKTGVNYLTVRGFTLRNAATPWAPPSAGQMGIVSAYWCKGWVVEANEICYSKCCGVALGKYGDEFDNTNDKGAADPYTECVRRALTNGWNKATVGSHLIRNNHIHHCEQTGIVGSLGCSFSTITGNEIHDIHVRQLFGGAEMAGIKFHGAIDVVIRGNHLYRCGDVAGIWLDWMAQGAQVMGNLLHDNTGGCGDVFCEMQHGPILVANNLFLSKQNSFALNSQGIAFVHNLVTSSVTSYNSDTRVTPFQLPHTTALAGTYPAAKGSSGDHRFYNNVFIAPCKLNALDNAALPCSAAGNVFTTGAQASRFDTDALLKPEFDPGVTLTQKSDGWYLQFAVDQAWRNQPTHRLVTTELLGKAQVTDCAYENADGLPLCVNTDYLGKKRDNKNPFPGPFEIYNSGKLTFKVWPLASDIHQL